MNLNITFFVTNILLGVGLAMDAFSVSLANGLVEPKMKRSRMCVIAGVFAGFQFAMPMIGYICVSTVAKAFSVFEKFIPWIALILLCYIGGKMLIEGIKDLNEKKTERANSASAAHDADSEQCGNSESSRHSEHHATTESDVTTESLGAKALLIQGVATSIDALSVGFTISNYILIEAILASLLIGIVTFAICISGLVIGKKAGTKLSSFSGILGGSILILIGLQIFVKGVM